MTIGKYVLAAVVLALGGMAVRLGAEPPADAAAAAVATSVSVDSTVIQRDGDTLRLLNTTVKGADGKVINHVDVVIKLSLDADLKVVRADIETHPTTLVGVDALVAGTYIEGERTFELKGPAVDVDMRPSWTIAGKSFNGTLVGGPLKGHPNLLDAKSIEGLPEAGVYGVVFHDRVFGGFLNSTKTLISLRQVADTLLLTGYSFENGKFVQTGVAILKAKKPDPPLADKP